MQPDNARVEKLLDMALDLYGKNSLLESKLDALAKASSRTPYKVESTPGHVSISKAVEIVRDIFGFDVDEEYMIVMFERADIYRGEVNPKTGICSYTPSPTALTWKLVDSNGPTTKGLIGVLELLQVQYDIHADMAPLGELQNQVAEMRKERKEREEMMKQEESEKHEESEDSHGEREENGEEPV